MVQNLRLENNIEAYKIEMENQRQRADFLENQLKLHQDSVNDTEIVIDKSNQ